MLGPIASSVPGMVQVTTPAVKRSYLCVCVLLVYFPVDAVLFIFVQQKIRRDREKREERRMGGKQQVAKGKLREK